MMVGPTPVERGLFTLVVAIQSVTRGPSHSYIPQLPGVSGSGAGIDSVSGVLVSMAPTRRW